MNNGLKEGFRRDYCDSLEHLKSGLDWM